jgi:hypothetical protein
MPKEDERMEKGNKTSDRSRLIKKHLEHVNWKAYKEALGKRQRGRGIYVLYKGDDIYYIGSSKSSLRSRLRRHVTRDRHKGKWDNFSFYQIGRTKYIKDTESLLLKIFRPKGNRIIGRFKSKYNLAKKIMK